MKKYNFNGIKKAIDRLYEIDKKYNDSPYVHFDIILGYKGNEAHVKYNIYTSEIGHNCFYSKKELIEFINNVCDKQTKYKDYNKAKIKEQLNYHRDEINSLKEELKRLD
jgi:hypothetical protein